MAQNEAGKTKSRLITLWGIMTQIDYGIAAETYDHTRTHSDAVIDRFRSVVRLNESVSVLDFGCGTGNYLARIQERFACQCNGVEPSEAMRIRAQMKSDNFTIKKGDHGAIPFPAEKFDFCYMTDVIHHVPDLVAMFRELLRVLKPAGKLCIVTEAHSQIEGRFYNRYFPSLAQNEKQRYPDISEIIDRAKESGFKLMSVETISSPARTVSGEFLRNVSEKNWSMFRLLNDSEFATGLAKLTLDQGCSFSSPDAGETLLWFGKHALRE